MASQKSAIVSDRAPSAIGTYSQAVRQGDLVFLSGQIPLDPDTMTLVEGDVERRIDRVLDNLEQVCRAAGGGLDDLVKVNVYLTDLGDFDKVNRAMAARLRQPYPARAVVQVEHQ